MIRTLLLAVGLVGATSGGGCSLFLPVVACDEDTPCAAGVACGADGYCGTGSAPADAGVAADGGADPDAGLVDAGRLDAGLSFDAGFDDGGTLDSGAAVDAGVDASVDAGPPAPRWHGRWLFRKAVTIPTPGGLFSLQEFPVWVSIVSDDELRHKNAGGGVDSLAGDDLRFGDDAGTIYAHELTRYEPASGRLEAFVKVPSVALNTDTTFFLYYGDSLATPVAQPWQTWSNGYRAVWHLDDDPGGGATVKDSANDPGASHASGVATNLESVDQVDGQVGRAIAFDGSDELIGVSGNHLNQSGPFTLEVWARMDAASTLNQRIYQRGVNGNLRAVELFIGNDANPGKITFRVNLGSGAPNSVTHNPPLQGGFFAYEQWFHYGATFQPGNAVALVEMRLWVNGSLVTINQLVDNGDDVITGVDYEFSAIGNGGAAVADHPWLGKLDEMRISSVVRTSDWLRLSHANQLSPSTFLTVGSAQGAP